MSTYEWEAGTIKIPSAEWAKTKTAIREAVNRRQSALLAVAEKAHAELVEKLPEMKKQRRNGTLNLWDFERTLDKIVQRHMEIYKAGLRGHVRVFDEFDHTEILQKIYVTRDPKTWKEITPKLRKPQKKDFPLAGSNVNSFQADNCSLVFDNDARTIGWHVPENNHAREHAHATVLGGAFFAAMKTITWTRGSGGVLVGNDEYNHDLGRENVGAGGSYVTHRFSAEAQKAEKEAERKRSMSYGGYGYGRGYRR
jgi:hypothetical protein